VLNSVTIYFYHIIKKYIFYNKQIIKLNGVHDTVCLGIVIDLIYHYLNSFYENNYQHEVLLKAKICFYQSSRLHFDP
jgi:hypothetical protein